MKKNKIFFSTCILMILSIFLLMTISSCDFTSEVDSNNGDDSQSEDYPDELIHGYWLNEDGELYLNFLENGDFTYNEGDVYVEGWFDLDGKYLILGFNDGSSYTGEFNYEDDSMAFTSINGTFYRATEDMLPVQDNNQQDDSDKDGLAVLMVDSVVGNWTNESSDLTYTFYDDGTFIAETLYETISSGTYTFSEGTLLMDTGAPEPLSGQYLPVDGVLAIDGYDEYFIFGRTIDSNNNQGAFILDMVGVWDNGNDVIIEFDEYGAYSIDSPVSTQYGTYSVDGSVVTMYSSSGNDIGAEYDPSDDTLWLEEFNWFYRSSGNNPYSSNEAYSGAGVVGTWESPSGTMTTFNADGTFYFQYSQGDSVTGTFQYYFSDGSFTIEADKNGYDFSTGYHDPNDDTIYLEGWNWFSRLE